MLSDRLAVWHHNVSKKLVFKSCNSALDSFQLRLDNERETTPA